MKIFAAVLIIAGFIASRKHLIIPSFTSSSILSRIDELKQDSKQDPVNEVYQYNYLKEKEYCFTPDRCDEYNFLVQN
jgi:hypothetical protein